MAGVDLYPRPPTLGDVACSLGYHRDPPGETRKTQIHGRRRQRTLAMYARTFLAALVLAAPIAAQAPPALTSNNPFPEPISATEGVIRVNFVEFATIPDFNNAAPRVMHLASELGTRRIFALNQSGPLFSISYDGR